MIKVEDIQYARIAAPDLTLAEKFLTDLGLVRVEHRSDSLYMRASDEDHYVLIAERGEPAFLGFGLKAGTAADLDVLAAKDGVSPVSDIDGPGGGQSVRLTDPAGFRVDVVHGITPLPSLAVPRTAKNNGSRRERLGEPAMIPAGPCQVKRLGHVVLFTPEFDQCVDFYRSHFGLLASDEMVDGNDNMVSSFLRCDRSETYVDHHTLYLKFADKTRCHHLGWEVEDLEAVEIGHGHMRDAGYKHNWGVGRHVVGSNIFDQWIDDWGNMHEYFADLDVYNAGHVTRVSPVAESLVIHWGPPHPYL